MVHNLRSHQAAFLPVHCPQVRGWDSWPLCPLLTSWPRVPGWALNRQTPCPSTQSSVPRASPKPDAGGRGEQDRLSPCHQGVPRLREVDGV